MTQVITLAAEARDRAGKGTSHALRRQDRVPAVIYGDKKAPISISMELKILVRYVDRPAFYTQLIDLEVGNAKHRVLPRDVQFDPVSDKPIHVDFLRISADTKIRVSVPVAFINSEKSPGIKRGGTLNIVHHEIEVLCAPDKIPARFEVSLEGCQINEAIHLSAIKLPEGVKLTTHEKDFTIATIAVPSAVRSEKEDAANAATGADAAAAEGAAAPAGAKGAAAKAAPAKGAAPAADAKKADKK